MVEGLTDAVIHVADASAITDVRSTTISWRFVTMPIKVDMLAGNARGGTIAKNGIRATSERYFAIYEIDNRELKNWDNAFAASMDRLAKFTPPGIIIMIYRADLIKSAFGAQNTNSPCSDDFRARVCPFN